MGQKEKIGSGTTTNSYTSTRYSKYTQNWQNKLILISNTGVSNGLTFKVYGVADMDDEADSTYLLQDETTLSADTVIPYRTEDPWEAIYVQVKSTVADSHTSYKVWVNRNVHA